MDSQKLRGRWHGLITATSVAALFIVGIAQPTPVQANQPEGNLPCWIAATIGRSNSLWDGTGTSKERARLARLIEKYEDPGGRFSKKFEGRSEQVVATVLQNMWDSEFSKSEQKAMLTLCGVK